MDHVEERLAEEVRKYDHLYNLWLTEYKDGLQFNCLWVAIVRSALSVTVHCVCGEHDW